MLFMMPGLTCFAVEVFIFCLLTSPQVFGTLANDTAWTSLGVLPYYVDERKGIWKQTVNRVSRAPKFCHTSTEFTSLQRNICFMPPSAAVAASTGYANGLTHCARQFEFERWNCSLLNKPRRVSRSYRYDDQVMPLGLKGTREEAFFYAITRAGIAHGITKSCAHGDIPNCKCDSNIHALKIRKEIKRHGIPLETKPTSFKGIPSMEEEDVNPIYKPHDDPVKNWKWGGCSDNIIYGIKYSRRKIDSRFRRNRGRRPLSISERVNLHNANVGRRVYGKSTTLKCSCHGMSGSCGLYTCWRNRGSMHKIASELKQLYGSAKKVILRRNKLEVGNQHKGRKQRRKVLKRELIYWKDTPDLCQVAPIRGIIGTRGRICKKGSGNKSDCKRLCCNGGSHASAVISKEKCDCKFLWCCDVECKDCTKNEIKHMCNR